jgi:hypothetical protein
MIALLAAACGSDPGDGGSAGGGDTESNEGRPGPAIEVTITLWPEGRGGPSREATLTCEPATGTHPDPERACALLTGDLQALEPVPPDAACTMIFGGPEEAEIAGVVNGEEVHATFSRTNGCELDRWDRLAGVLQLGD